MELIPPYTVSWTSPHSFLHLLPESQFHLQLTCFTLPDLWPKHLCSTSGQKCYMDFLKIVIRCRGCSNDIKPQLSQQGYKDVYYYSKILHNSLQYFSSFSFFPPLFCFPCHSPQGVNSVSVFHSFFFFSASSIKHLLQQYSDCVISANGKFNTNGRMSADMLECIHLAQWYLLKINLNFQGMSVGAVRCRNTRPERMRSYTYCFMVAFHSIMLDAQYQNHL